MQLFDKFNATLAVNAQTYEILGIPNLAPRPDAASTFQSLLELAKRGEYGAGRSRDVGAGTARGMREMIGKERR